jgi:ABC-type branched-subunit amino acid transport system permease subunit
MLYAIAYTQVYFAMGILPGLKAFVAAVLGGIGSIPGAVVGALIMGQAEVMSAGYISTPMRDAIAFTILILVLLELLNADPQVPLDVTAERCRSASGDRPHHACRGSVNCVG